MVDLHCHSWHSDGLWSPEEMATRAFNSGVRVWSLTDHDTSRGWDEAKQACDNHVVGEFSAFRIRVQNVLSTVSQH